MNQRPWDRRWLRSPDARRWVAIGVFLVLYTLLLTAMSRYFEWDEAVYFSQSGPLSGGVTGPAYYSPSRELGTAWLTALLRVVAGSSIVLVRLGWVVVSAVAIVVAFRQIGKVGPRWAGEIGALLFGTFWITTGYMGSLFGSLLGAVAMLLATALYLRLANAQADDLPAGAMLGLALAGGFYMRTVETVVVLLILLLHSATFGRTVWRRQWRAVGAASATFVAGFVVPWMIHSTAVYGSPVGHATAWIERRGRRSGGDEFPVGWHNGAPEWLQALLGDSHLGTDTYPQWPGIIIGLALLALVAAVVWAIANRVRAPRSAPPGGSSIGLLLALSAASFSLFFFLVADDRDRYAFYGAVFAAAVAGQLIALGVPTLRRRLRHPAVPAALGLSIVLWVVANATLASFYDDVRAESADVYRRAARVVEQAADGRRCKLFFSPQVIPHVAVGSPCRVGAQREMDGPPAKAEQVIEDGDVAMVFWRRSNGRWNGGAEWRAYKRFSVTPGGPKVAVLYVRES